MSIDKVLNKAFTLYNQGNLSEAAKMYQKILKQLPDNLDATYALGTIYTQLGRLQDAERYLVKAAKMAPWNPSIHINLGNLYKEVKKFDLGIECFSRALELQQDSALAYYGLGSILEAMPEHQAKALECFNKTIALAPTIAEAHFGLAKILQRSGKIEALDHFATASRLKPDLIGLNLAYGMACLQFGKQEEAAEKLRLALQLDPNDVMAGYFLAILEGRQPDKKLQEKYVQMEFDGFAEKFETQLTERLNYNLPSQLVDILAELFTSSMHFDSVVDLGCGTGLSGNAIKPYADTLVGIDLSDKMLQISRERNCYDTLIQGDLIAALQEMEHSFDLFIATDVFVYLGDLREVFSAIKNRSKPGAMFIFSTEHHPETGFILQDTGRYAHSIEYIRSVAESSGCQIIKELQIPLRTEHKKWLTGDVYVIKFP